MNVERLAAPDGALVVENRGWKTTGARACALGHRLAWRSARKKRAESAVVFEDDVLLCRDFQARMLQLRIPEDWSIFYFGCTFRDVPHPVSEGVVRVTGTTWETHAMMVHARLFPKLHKLVAPFSRRHGPKKHGIATEIAIDNLMAEIHGEEKVYAAYPALAWQTFGLSNIENGLRGLWTADGRQTTHPEVIAELERRINDRRRCQGVNGEKSPQ